MVGTAVYAAEGKLRPEDIPQIQAELKRIWDDCKFVCSGTDWEAIGQRLEGYKELDILG